MFLLSMAMQSTARYNNYFIFILSIMIRQEEKIGKNTFFRDKNTLNSKQYSFVLLKMAIFCLQNDKSQIFPVQKF